MDAGNAARIDTSPRYKQSHCIAPNQLVAYTPKFVSNHFENAWLTHPPHDPHNQPQIQEEHRQPQEGGVFPDEALLVVAVETRVAPLGVGAGEAVFAVQEPVDRTGNKIERLLILSQRDVLNKGCVADEDDAG